MSILLSKVSISDKKYSYLFSLHSALIWWQWHNVVQFQYPIRRLIVRSHKVSKPRDWQFKSSHRFEIWQALRQQCCQGACQISERSNNFKYKSRGFETSRDLTIRRLIGYWNIWTATTLLPFGENGCFHVRVMWQWFTSRDVCSSILHWLCPLQRRHNEHRMTSKITSLTIVYSTVYSGINQTKYQSFASLAFHRWPVNSPHKGPVTRKIFPFGDVIILQVFGSK